MPYKNNNLKVASLCLSVLLLFAAHHATALSLSFGVYTADSPTTVVAQFRPLLNVIEKRLTSLLNEPVTIKMQIAPTYKQGVDDLVNGRVDFSRLGPASYVMAKQANAQLSILAMESKKGQKRFRGVICVAEQSPIMAIADLKGKNFAFGNQRSTIGRYLAQLHLMNAGIYASDLGEQAYLERHDQVGLAVAQGHFEAGALKESTFKRLVEQGSRLRVLTAFDNVTKPWVASHRMQAKLQKQLKSVLLSIDDQAALKALKKDGFLPGKDEDYQMIRTAIVDSSKFDA